VLLSSCVKAGRFASVLVLWLLNTVRIWVITGTSLPGVNLHTATPMSRLLLRAPLTSKAWQQQQQQQQQREAQSQADHSSIVVISAATSIRFSASL
jgi:hypothetical protein